MRGLFDLLNEGDPLEPARNEAYVARNARRAVAIMAEDDEVDELQALESLLVKGRNLASLIEACAKARRMRSYLKKLAR